MKPLVLALMLGPAALAAREPTPVTVAALPVAVSVGKGAAVPFTEYEAENADIDGRVIGPDRRFGTVAAEASGRRAVELGAGGGFVAFTLAHPASAITVRYALPDSADGRGLDAALAIEADGASLGTLALTSRYGWFYGKYPFSNRPADGGGHHVFDHARLHLGRTLPAGTVVRLGWRPQGEAKWVAIDLADFEGVPPPLPAPAGALAVTSYGADPTGLREAGESFRRGIAAARRLGVPLWIPPGRYSVNGHLEVDRVTIAGAGMWHSVLQGTGVGLYGRTAPHGSRRVELRDFAIIGNVQERVDATSPSGIGGAMGGGTRIERLWLQHHKVGLWFDGPLDGITISGLRVLDMTADGINFRRGVSNAVLENSFFRGTGDDGIAAWSQHQPDHGIVIRRNTVIAPVLANGIALYGGRDLRVADNLVADTLTQGGGLHVGNRFGAVPVAGRIALSGNLLVRSGSFDPNWRFGVGALWFYALDAPMTAAIAVRDTVILDSSEEAVHFIGKPIRGVTIDGARIAGAKGAAIKVQAGGEARIANSTATDVAVPAILICAADFDLADGGGNTGLQTRGSAACP